MDKYIIGIDIGGSKIIAGLVKNAEVFHKTKIPTPKNKKEFFIELQLIIGQLIERAGGRKNIKGIGCGIGGALELQKGMILSWSNVKFLDGFNIKNWLKDKFKYEVKIDNDARCFTRGEYLWGAGKGYKNIIGITLGTGVGGGIIINGKIIYGANGSAGEIGHMVIDQERNLEELTVKLVRKNKFSEKSINKSKKNLGIGIANIINILDPEAIVIGGGAAKAMKKFIVSPIAGKKVKILTAKLGENAGVVGAAALFL